MAVQSLKTTLLHHNFDGILDYIIVNKYIVSLGAANKIEIAAADSYLSLQCIWKER